MKFVFALFFLGTLSLPLALELAFPNWQQISLGGVTKTRALPQPTWENLSSGVFQKRFERWFFRKLGIQPLLIKSDNEINYRLFSQLSSSHGGKAILGREGHLLEKIYIKRAQGALRPKHTLLQEKVRELKRLQKQLQRRGIPLLILISPNKPSLYPETIPFHYRIHSSHTNTQEAPSTREIFTNMLDSHKIPYIDGKAILQQREQDFRYRYFSPTGTHWSELGSCLIVEEFLTKAEDLLARGPLPKLQCEVHGVRKLPLPMDRDLLSVANLWTPKSLVSAAPLVKRNLTAVSSREHFPPPSALFVGTSYLWSFFYNLDKTGALSRRDMYYYFKRSVPFPRGKEEPLKRSSSSWIVRALEHDLIVLEVNEAFLHRIGYGFPKRALRFLKSTPHSLKEIPDNP